MTAQAFGLLLLATAAFLSAAMVLAWLADRQAGNAGWIDATWTFAVGAAGAGGALSAYFLHGHNWRSLLVAVLALLWSARLGGHIVQRTLSKDDDPRYAKLRREWGADAPSQMFRFLQIQALVSIPLSMSIWLAAFNPSPAFSIKDAVAIALMLIAIGGEASADSSMRAFKADPANNGKVCDAGLWAWSRHPNYFFEWLGWTAYAVFAVDFTGAYVWGWLALLAPACMYWLLNHVSGIPPLEDIMVAKYGAAYRDYQARTSAFFPMPPTARRN